MDNKREVNLLAWLFISLIILTTFVVMVYVGSREMQSNAYESAYNKAMNSDTTNKFDVSTGETVVSNGNSVTAISDGYGKVLEKNTEVKINSVLNMYGGNVVSKTTYWVILEDTNHNRTYYEMPKNIYVTIVEGDYIKFTKTLTEIIEVEVITEEDYNNI